MYGRGYSYKSATPSGPQKAWDPACNWDTNKELNHFIHCRQTLSWSTWVQIETLGQRD